MKRTICAIISLVLIFSLCVPAYAATPENVQQYDVYTSFGDSIPSCADWEPDAYTNLRFEEKEGTYPALIKNYLGAKHNSWSYGGFTTRELCYMLDANYELDEYAFMFTGKKCKTEIDEKREYIKKDIEESDVITINIGANDIFSLSVIKAIYGMQEYPYLETGIDELDSTVKTVLTISSLVNSLTYAMESDYLQFYENMGNILCTIKKMNPDAEIILIGIYNPIEGMPLNTDSEVELGNLFALFTERVNIAISSFANIYNCKYVDINGTPTALSEEYESLSDDGLLNDFIYAMHPSRNGHQYIAEKVISILPERKDYSISLDVSEFKKIDCVYLDGVAYPAEVKDGVATVKCESREFETAAVYGYKSVKLAKFYSQKVWKLSYSDGVCTPTYVSSVKNPLLYSKVNTLVIAKYGSSIVSAK